MRGIFFYDMAQVSRNNVQAGDIASASLSSIGAGIRLNYKENTTFKLDIASTLKASSIQKKGAVKLHMALKYIF